MKWPLQDRYQIYSLLAPETVVNRMTEACAPHQLIRRKFWRTSSTKTFEGAVTGTSFQMQRVIFYKNSFLPRLEGEVLPDSTGTIIRVSARLPLFIHVFMIIWLAGVAFATLFTLPAFFIGGMKHFPLLIPPGMLVFGIGLSVGAFQYENKKAKEELCRICQGSELKDPIK